MKRLNIVKIGLTLALLLACLWVGPPAAQRMQGICPQRPNGVQEASALPVFARKYGTSCTTCHSAVPIKLNNFGQAFRSNGYRMPGGDEAFVKHADQELGAEAWKELWPKAVWPGAIPSQVPLAFQIYLDARYDPHNELAGTQKKPKFWFDVPHELEIMTAGTAGEHISWWGNVEFVNAGTLSLVQAWGQFDNLLDTTLLNVRVGRMEPRFVPFSRVTQRFIATDFLTSEFAPTVGGSARHRFNVMQSGLEVWGVKSVQATGGGLQYAAGLVNGGGPAVADETNDAKDYYARLAYKFGGMGVGRSLADTGELKQSENWIDDSVRVGVSGYGGKWGASEFAFSRLGLDVDLWFKTVNVYGIYMRGSDEGLLVNRSTGTVNSNAFTLGVDWTAFPWLTAVLRYEGTDHENLTADGFKRAVKRFVPGVIVAIRPNVTWTTEFVGYLKVDGRTSGDDVARTRLRFIF